MRLTTALVALMISALTISSTFAANGDPLPSGAGEREALLRADLDSAREAGNMRAAARIEEEIAALRGTPCDYFSEVPEGRGLRVEAPGGESDLEGERWTEEDILVSAAGWSEVRPSAASDEEGNLYVAFEMRRDPETVIRVFRSENGGMYWEHWRTISAYVDLTNPSIAIGDGSQRWFLLVYQYADTEIQLFRVNLDSLDQYDFRTIEQNVVGVSNPRIATDGAEWAGWYPYVVWNSKGVDNWVLRFSRSLDYGDSWQAPATLHGYCGYPDEFYDGNEAFPDIDYGSRCLYAAFDNYPAPCTSTDRDVYAMKSSDYGATWASAIRLTSEADDEHGPRIGAVKNYLDERTAVVAYTRFWSGLDDDVVYHGTEDGGTSWSMHLCLSCAPDVNEKSPDLEASASQGKIHAAWWRDGNIESRSAPYTSPLAWGDTTLIGESGEADAAFPRPSVLVDPTAPLTEEMGVAWADARNAASADDIYFDAEGGNPTRVEEAAETPAVTRLDPISPNPFNPAAVLRFRLSAPGAVRLTVHDVTGRRIAVLVDGASGAGEFEAVWNGLDRSGRPVPSGVYFARLQAGEYAGTRKMVLVR